MGNVKVVTDSTADIPKELVSELDITVVPLKVNFQDHSYEDGVDLSPADFYQKLGEAQVIPTTSQPTPYQFEEVYRSVENAEDTTIISIHLSSKLSGTYQAATIALGEVQSEYTVHVVNSKKASYAIGIIVVEIAKMAKAGASAEQCIERLQSLLKDTTVYFVVDTLDFLQKNGRIGKASAMLGSLLKIKPILSLNEDGEVYPFEKVRGQKKAIARMIEALKEQYGDEPVHVGVSHAVNEPLANELLELARKEFNVQSEVLTSIGAVIGAHVGPGTVSLSLTKASAE
ncbi:DegV family protein [Halalkalibacterium ligniniphilum]|uniref:DegV family protein n=1 Tax=Halalkalibacterium ligniniphilum TaxID=1134413 RepID=UPI000349A7B2|nr:DegV family protein [Halalkalibacterium ligniniphilum]